MNTNARISVVVNLLNEGHLIEDCIASVRPWAAEVIVGEMGSTDGGRDRAMAMGAKVIDVPWAPYGEHTLIRRVQEASGDWIFALDPDMRVSPETWQRIEALIHRRDIDAVSFNMRNWVFGRAVVHGHGSTGNFVKLFRREAFLRGYPPSVTIHTMISDALTRNGARIVSAGRRWPIDHLAYQRVDRCLEQHVRYAQVEACERLSTGESSSIPQMLFEVARKAVGDLIVRAAWRSGREGVAFSLIALMMLCQMHLLMMFGTGDAKEESKKTPGGGK